jgi:hypothetical protein
MVASIESQRSGKFMESMEHGKQTLVRDSLIDVRLLQLYPRIKRSITIAHF